MRAPGCFRLTKQSHSPFCESRSSRHPSPCDIQPMRPFCNFKPGDATSDWRRAACEQTGAKASRTSSKVLETERELAVSQVQHRAVCLYAAVADSSMQGRPL